MEARYLSLFPGDIQPQYLETDYAELYFRAFVDIPSHGRVDSAFAMGADSGFMRCPHCDARGVSRRFRRAGVYPIPAAMLYLGYPIAVAWTSGCPWFWRCDQCGGEFRGHSACSRLCRSLAWLMLGLVLFLILGTVTSVVIFLWLSS